MENEGKVIQSEHFIPEVEIIDNSTPHTNTI